MDYVVKKKKKTNGLEKKPDAYRIVSYRQLVQFDSALLQRAIRIVASLVTESFFI
jgi:hypothetical protein